ncbi:MarR family transcriptional regulator [Pontibacter sp. G13]|uniref:MarR family winged helix-turn-helix transcriptional regulator n=1 Tax=Pontibacter sp. G13 TaxID=3074898 RepID=UPI00288AB276|nr:MarR family transcriptional regulator [Pontibacter sp. G13]WNJ20753.1 MarR family transcriptional regulator [Pontibacter sp. G13]
MSNVVTEPNVARLEASLNNLVLALNSRRNAILNKYNVNEMEVDIIRYLTEEEQKKMKEVGEHFNIKLSTLTSTIDKLEKNKLVKRKNSKEDRRVIFIRPTNKGQTLLTDLTGPAQNVAAFVNDNAKSSELTSLQKRIDEMIDFLNK